MEFMVDEVAHGHVSFHYQKYSTLIYHNAGPHLVLNL